MRKIRLLFTVLLSMIAWTGVMAQTAAEYEAALAAITDGAQYRIFSDVGGTKYYVTAGGTLTTDKAKGDAFKFAKITEGGAYVVDESGTKAVGIQLTSSANTRFTNAPLNNNKAVLEVSNYSTSSNDRKDWETQVFFLKEGKYAIRSCNTAYATESWGDAGRTFWTYTVEPVAPLYSYDPAYVWELEEYTETPEQLEALAKVQAWPVYVQSAAGLVKDASKFYSNAKEPSEGSYEALVDGEYTTFFHSAWSVSVDDDHYLQAELSQATQKFEFYFKKRSQNNNNRPTTIVISASNDGEEFTEITTLDSGFPTDAANIDYFSGIVDLGAAYKYVRFTVTATNNGTKFFTFSEFYLFPEAAAELAPIYNTYASALAGDLTDANISEITNADKALKAQISTINVTYELYEADGTTLVTSKTVVQKPYSAMNIPSTFTSNSFYDYTPEDKAIGDTDCTIKVIRSLKPGYVGALADLSNSKAYYIYCDRGKFLTKEDHLASTAHSSLTDAEPTAFAVLNYEDNYYLYSVVDKKFVTNTGALAGNLIADGFHGTLDAVQMEAKEVPYFFWYFTVAEGTNYGLNTNGNDPYGYVINDWMNADPGNMYYMVEAADFDATEPIAALEGYFHPSYTVTYVVKDEFGNTIFTSDPQPTTAGTVISTLPNDYKRTFYTYNEDEVEVTIADLATTVEFKATWTGPFELSADYASAHWYNMSMRGTWYVTTDVKDGDGAYKTQDANTMGLGEDSYQWAFTGNGYDGIKILNKAEGEGKSFGWTDAQKTNAGIPTVLDDAEGYHGWKIVASTNTSVPANSFCLNVPGTNLYINQYGGAGGSVKFWNSANNVGDPGSAFTVYEVPSDFSEYVVNEVAPALEATGYFTFTDAAKAAIGYDPAFKESCSFADFKSMKQKMAAAMESISNFILPENGYYTLKNKLYGTYMGIDPSDANMYGNYKTAVAAKQIVKLIRTGKKTYQISLMGKFSPATVAQSAQVTATEEEGTYTVVVSSVGYAAFQANPEVNMSALHCASGGSVVGWEPTADGSQWAATDASSIELTVGEQGYATAYLPFPVEIGKTITVPAAKGAWTFEDGTTDGTGIATLYATEGVTFADGVATIPAGNKKKNGSTEYLKMATNANGDLTTYSFMMDVKINNEDGGKYTALYSNNPTLEADGSLFFYNHKTEGRGIGINAGGLGYGAKGSIELDTWYRVIFSCNNGIPTVFVDGVKVAAASSTADIWTMHDVAIFFGDNDGEENEISCDELRFWDVALTENEAAMLGAVGTVIPEPQSVAAYTAELTDHPEGHGQFLTLTEVEEAIPALTGVVLKAEPAVYAFNIVNDPADFPEIEIPEGDLGIYETPVNGGQALTKAWAVPAENNILKGTLEPIDAAGLYVLAKPEGKEICFYEAASGTIAAGKAYLELPAGTEIKGFKFGDDDATAIENVNVNDKLNGLIFNIAGQRLNKMQKGINIVNGKKVLK
jgi:hypothetical protein